MIAGVVSYKLLGWGGGWFSRDWLVPRKTSTRGLCILYITLIGRKFSKPDDGHYRPKHVVFYC